jgi:hypothetical protein
MITPTAHRLLVLMAACAFIALPLRAQTALFSYSVRAPLDAPQVLVDTGGLITLPTVAPNTFSSALFSITNQGSAPWRIASVQVQGPYFTTSIAGEVTIGSGGSYAFPIQFAPVSTGQFAATLTIRFTATTGVSTQTTFRLTGNAATAPAPTTPTVPTTPAPAPEASSVAVSYVFLDRGNSMPIASGEPVPFPDTSAGTRVLAGIVITNRGSASTTVSAVSISGAGFEFIGLPLLPAQVIAGGELRFNVAFQPQDGNTYRGELKITIAGQTRTHPLSGQGISGQIAYELVESGVASRLLPGSTIVFPNLSAGSGSTIVTVRFRNTGNGDSRLTGVAVSGSAFFLLDQPPPPIILRPGEDLAIRIQFTAQDVTEYTGQLRIDSATFPLVGKGTGARLTAYLLLGEERFLLRSNTRGVIPNTDVGGRRQFLIEVTNVGDEPAPVAAIQLSGEGFALLQTPPLPTRIAAGQTLLLAGSFAPTQVGAVIGFLAIQELSFQMLGVGSDPPALPTVRFLGLPETPQALQQPAVALELETTYPYDLTGTLRLAFTTDTYIDDPAIQFLNGLRSIEFRIPANARRAIFGSRAEEIRMQTGSIAGTITLTAQINTGKVDLTRATPPVAVLNLAPAPPVIRLVEFVARSSKSFELVITGAVTSRTLSKFNFTLKAKPGAKLATTSLSADVSRAFESWFQSSNSRAYGGQFRASVVFDLTADFSAIESIDVTATNSLGTSLTRQVKPPAPTPSGGS